MTLSDHDRWFWSKEPDDYAEFARLNFPREN